MPSTLERVDHSRIPLPEVSGLCCLVGAGPTTLVALGDDKVSIAVTEVDADGSVGEWSVVSADDIGADPLASRRFRQLEAVALDGADRAWVLTEGTSLIAGVDLSSHSVVGVLSLDTATIPELHESWSRPDASRGEGLLLLIDGHVLVAKEKDPAGFVEFGPAGASAAGVSAATLLPSPEAFTAVGDTLVALAWWQWTSPELEDLSDLALDHDGGVWVLSDESRSLAPLLLPVVPGAEVCIGPALRLPKKTGKPEGLAFLPTGLVAVADDRHDTDDNLWLFRYVRS